MDTMEAAAKAEKERANSATEVAENAGLLHNRSLAAVDAYLKGITEFRAQMVKAQEESETQWQTRNNVLRQEAAALQLEYHARNQQVAPEVQQSAQGKQTTGTHSSIKGLTREFVGDVVDLPLFMQQPDQETITKCGAVWACLQKVGTFEQMPTATFGMLGIPPHALHTMVGDAFWEACWGAEQNGITWDHYIPFQMIRALKHILEVMTPDTIRCQSHAAAGQVILDTLMAEKVRLQV